MAWCECDLDDHGPEAAAITSSRKADDSYRASERRLPANPNQNAIEQRVSGLTMPELSRCIRAVLPEKETLEKAKIDDPSELMLEIQSPLAEKALSHFGRQLE